MSDIVSHPGNKNWYNNFDGIFRKDTEESKPLTLEDTVGSSPGHYPPNGDIGTDGPNSSIG